MAMERRSAVPAGGLNGTDLPAFFRAADRASIHGQRDFMRLTLVSLTALIVGAGSGFAGGTSGGTIAVASFVLAIIVRSFMLSLRPERAWYDGRALAESAKTLAWRYAVCAGPFGHDQMDPDAVFAERLRGIMQQVNDITLEAKETDGDQVTAAMRSLRAMPLAERRAVYKTHRIADQQAWYASRSRKHAARARILGLATLLVEFGGVVAGVLQVTGTLDFDIFAVLAALAAGLIAWERARQDSTLARAYAIAAQELGLIGMQVDRQATEEDWSTFVDEAEEAISREHTLWRASKST